MVPVPAIKIVTHVSVPFSVIKMGTIVLVPLSAIKIVTIVLVPVPVRKNWVGHSGSGFGCSDFGKRVGFGSGHEIGY